jgi:nitrate/nitrite transport system substrate-binding protein
MALVQRKFKWPGRLEPTKGSTMIARACRLAAPLAAALLGPPLWAVPVEAETLAVEKPNLKLGFIKLTDMVPLAIAYEKGFFKDEGLFVTLEPRLTGRFCSTG